MTNADTRRCCDGECSQGRDCPARQPVEYHTGWPRLDNFLNAVAYGATLGFALVLVLVLTWVVWGLQ